MTVGTWPLDHQVGSAAAFHARELPEPLERAVWWFEVDRPAVALGSTQRDDVVDRPAAAAAGVEVLRRRSGGGAVWLAPDEVTWVDVLVPAGDRWWDHDVGRAAHWLGAAWVEVLDRLGRPGGRVHTGGLVRTPWSDLVCFGGVGPGEVVVDGAKVVGIAQRRTRAGARFQCAVLHRWDPTPLLAVLALDDEARSRAASDLADAGAGVADRSVGRAGGPAGAVEPGWGARLVDTLGEVLATR